MMTAEQIQQLKALVEDAKARASNYGLDALQALSDELHDELMYTLYPDKPDQRSKHAITAPSPGRVRGQP